MPETGTNVTISRSAVKPALAPPDPQGRLGSTRRSRMPGPAGSGAAHPLDTFYAMAGLPLPQLRNLSGRTIPQPYRGLLVHTRDMTPTLEAFYGETIDLQVLRRRLQGGEYLRQVVLRLRVSGHPVEFGANRVKLDAFPEKVRNAILAEREPLGHLLRDFAVEHSCQPNAFVRLHADPLIAAALGIDEGRALYGRHNRLFDLRGRLLSEVVEILAPDRHFAAEGKTRGAKAATEPGRAAGNHRRTP
jgi:hypothetical protein